MIEQEMDQKNTVLSIIGRLQREAKTRGLALRTLNRLDRLWYDVYSGRVVYNDPNTLARKIADAFSKEEGR